MCRARKGASRCRAGAGAGTMEGWGNAGDARRGGGGPAEAAYRRNADARVRARWMGGWEREKPKSEEDEKRSKCAAKYPS